MGVDTTIRFNDHNSYKVTSILMSYPFYVKNMIYITHSFQAYATTALASATRARTKFIGANGATISDVSHSFAVTEVFDRVEITVAVPATAVQAQLVFLQGGTDWWIAEPKTESGEDATPYETFETRLTKIDDKTITLSAAIDDLSNNVSNHELRVTTIEAGQASFVKFDDLGTLDGTYINGGNIKTGKIQSVSGASYFDLTNGEIKSNNVDLTGKITATSGSIGAWNISSNKLISTNGRLSLDPVSEQDVLGD